MRVTCALCGHAESNVHAISEHWKSAHPVEYKKKQKAKKAKFDARVATAGGGRAEPEDTTDDVEQQLIANAVFYFDEAVNGGISAAGRARVLAYLSDRFSVKPGVMS